MTISKIWKLHSDKIIPRLSAQTVGIAIQRGIYYKEYFRQVVLRTRIFDAGVGNGSRKIIDHIWSMTSDRSQFSCLLQSTLDKSSWKGRTGLRSELVQALKNHIGSVDQHGSLEMHAPPVAHPLYFNHQQHEECFMYERSDQKGEHLSIVLDENAIVTPVPASITAVTRETLLSLAVPIWRWWRLERPSVRKDQHGIITNIRIMYVSRSDYRRS